MNSKILSFVAAALAFLAAGLAYFLADPGENVTLSVAVPLIMGCVFLWMGLRGREPQKT